MTLFFFQTTYIWYQFHKQKSLPIIKSYKHSISNKNKYPLWANSL